VRSSGELKLKILQKGLRMNTNRIPHRHWDINTGRKNTGTIGDELGVTNCITGY